jgi:hypothetical protein
MAGEIIRASVGLNLGQHDRGDHPPGFGVKAPAEQSACHIFNRPGE